MRKMIMVVMMVMTIMTGCTNDMRHVGKMCYLTCRPEHIIALGAITDTKIAVDNIMDYEEPYVSDEYLEEVAFNSQKNDWAN